MTTTHEPPVIYIPDDDELEAQLQVTVPIEKRMRYVRSLLDPVVKIARGVDNLQRRIDDLEASRESMAIELRALRQKLGSLSDSDRAAVEQRYEMLGQIRKARGRLDQFERETAEAIRVMREALSPPK